MQDQSGFNLAQLLLFTDILDFFTITDVVQSHDVITINLDENEIHLQSIRTTNWYQRVSLNRSKYGIPLYTVKLLIGNQAQTIDQ